MTNPISPRNDRGECASAHRATDASHEALLHGLRLSVGIDFRDGPAAEWAFERHDLAKQLVADSRKDISE